MNPAVKKLAVYAGTFIILTSASGLAWASGVTIPNTFVGGTPAKAAEVNANFSAVKTAVDDNDARITGVINNTQAGALKTAVDANTAAIAGINTTNTTQTTDIDNLKGNLANGACRANDGTVDANAVRVGPLCVDKYRARLTIGSCAADGVGATCDGVVAQSTATGTAATNISWAQAARICANAGKRLPTPGEYMMARTVGTVLEMTGLEWVDAVSWAPIASFTYPGTPGDPYPAGTDQNVDVVANDTAPVQVGYMGPRSGTIQFFVNADFTDTTLVFITFRCVR